MVMCTCISPSGSVVSYFVAALCRQLQLDSTRLRLDIDVLDNWDKYTAKQDGDAIRRLIGTIGVSSPLSSIRKAFTSIRDAEEESVRMDARSWMKEFTRLQSNCLAQIYQLWCAYFQHAVLSRSLFHRT